jgi:hypothetical protein
MQNKYFKFLITALAVAVIVPQVALAAWWNPMSWGIWNKIFGFQKNGQAQQQNRKIDFEIKEFGIKFKTDISDLLYVVKNNESGSNVLFSTKSLAPLDPKCSPYSAPIGAINVSSAVPNPDSYYNQSRLLFSKDGVYIYYDSPQAPCSTNKTASDLQLKQTQSLAKALKTISLTKTPGSETVGWKTYEDTVLKISIKYPPSWTYQKFSCNVDGVAFCLSKQGATGCGQTCAPNSPTSPIYLYNYTGKPVVDGTSKGETKLLGDMNTGLTLSDKTQRGIYTKMISTFKFTKPMPVVGGDKDVHGCIGSAGYTWCETKQKCLRTWEEKCQ